MKSFWFAFCCSFTLFFQVHPARATESIIQDRLSRAAPGDFIVTESHAMVCLMVVRSVTDRSLVVEEICAPSSILQSRPFPWSDWLRNNAPGHTSWSMAEIDLQDHQLLECYSFSHCAWLQISSRENIVATLLGLRLHPVPDSEKRRIGPPPSDGDPDYRSIWRPPLIENGTRLDDMDFDVYQADWPEDGSELSGNQVSLYFDRENHLPFPVWIQIDTSQATVSSHMIDSGKNLPAVHRSIPRRVPEFVGSAQKTDAGLRLSLKSPKYYRSFDLFAVDVTMGDKRICPISHSLITEEGGLLRIEIPQTELQGNLQTNHRYTWLIVPTGYSEFYSESRKPFLWKTEP